MATINERLATGKLRDLNRKAKTSRGFKESNKVLSDAMSGEKGKNTPTPDLTKDGPKPKPQPKVKAPAPEISMNRAQTSAMSAENAIDNLKTSTDRPARSAKDLRAGAQEKPLPTKNVKEVSLGDAMGGQPKTTPGGDIELTGKGSPFAKPMGKAAELFSKVANSPVGRAAGAVGRGLGAGLEVANMGGAGPLLGAVSLARSSAPDFYAKADNVNRLLATNRAPGSTGDAHEFVSKYKEMYGESPVGPLAKLYQQAIEGGVEVLKHISPAQNVGPMDEQGADTPDPGIDPNAVDTQAAPPPQTEAEAALPKASEVRDKATAALKSKPPAGGVETKGGLYPIFDKGSSEAADFRQSFGNAKGQDFEWQGRKYSGKTK